MPKNEKKKMKKRFYLKLPEVLDQKYINNVLILGVVLSFITFVPYVPLKSSLKVINRNVYNGTFN